MSDPTLRLYAIVRSDLGMSAGKIASQAGHAYLGAFLQSPQELQKEYQADGMGTKVCLSANLVSLFRAEYEAQQAGIPTFKVVDSGCADFFGGKPIVTALGIGPARKEQIQHITKKLKLL